MTASRPLHPVASTRSSDPAAIQELLPAARALARGDTETALASLEVLAVRRRDDPPTRLLLGLLAWRSDDLADAIALVRSAHEADPDNGSYAEVLAALYAAAGNLNESLFLGKLATGMGIDATLHELVPPDFPSFGKAFLAIEERPLAVAARNAVSRDRPDQAIRYLRDHLTLFPHDSAARADLVRLLLAEERFGEAVAATHGLAARGDAEGLSLTAQARCAAGEHAVAAGNHDAAAMLQGLDTDQGREIAARRLSDLWWCEPDAGELAAACRAWVAACCPAPPARRRPVAGQKLTLGFLVAGEVRPEVRVALAQICRAFNRQNVQTIGFGLGPATHPRNAVYRAAFVLWRDLRQVDPATMARIFAGEGIDVLIDAAGFANPAGVMAVAMSDVPLRLLWPQLPMAPDGPPYDFRLAAGQGGAPRPGGPPELVFGPSDSPAPALARLPAPTGGSCPAAQQDLVFGCDLRPAQATREMIALLAAIAMAVPGASIAIRDNGFSEPGLTERLLDGFGPEAASVVTLVKAADAAEFCRYLDVAIAPILPASAEPLVAALLAGCPVLSMAGDAMRDGGYRDLLAAAGLPDLACDGPAALIRRAAALALEPERLQAARAALRKAGLRQQVSASRLADGMEAAIRQRLEEAAGPADGGGAAHG